MFINWQQRELNLKIVYYGPALSGKTTNLEQLHARVNPERRSQLISLKTSEDRTLYFDFFQVEMGKISGLTPKLHLYTVPGQSYYEASRKVVLRGADGVVFVVDSAPNRLRDNLALWKNMQTHLTAEGIVPAEFPIVIQLNKRDLANAVPSAYLKRLLQIDNYPLVEAIASQGQGVQETFKAIVGGVIARVQRESRPSTD